MRLFAKRLTKRPAGRPARSFRPTFERLESRELLSTTPVTPPSDLQDPLVKPIAAAEFVQDKGKLTRADVIHLLEVVDGTRKAVFDSGKVSFTPATPGPTAVVTASELSDLQTLVSDACLWGLSPDVANLAGKVVNQNPANENYQGAPLLPAGQLTAGTPVAALQDLVGKWFYGTDLPATAAAAANNGIPDTVVYETARGTLFGKGGPSASDVAQGWVGDCYFLSPLGEVARQAPGTIKSMFINNGDGTCTVRFFEYEADNNTWHPDYVTVNLQLPVLQQSGQFAFAGWYQGGKPATATDTSNVLWPALVEKAYAQLAEEGWSRAAAPGGSGIDGTPADWNQNSYDALSAGDAVAMEQLTGSSTCYDVGLATASRADESALAKAFAHGSLVVLGSLGSEPAGVPTSPAGVPLVIPGHVYRLESCNFSKNQFTLVNPYDDSSAYAGDGQRTVTLSWAQMQQYLNDFFVLAPPPICPQHAVVVQGQESGATGNAAALDLQWFDNGQAISSPSQAHEGDTVTVTFSTAAAAPATEFSLVAYAAPSGTFNSSNIDHQQEWADSTVTVSGASPVSLSVTLPGGYFQLDLVTGGAISDFATGERYHGDRRFIAGATGGDHVVSCGC